MKMYASNLELVLCNFVILALLAILPWMVYVGDMFLIVMSLVIWQVFSVLGISVGAHRLFAHRSFETYTPVKWILACLSMWSFNGPPCFWAFTHNAHHRFSDRKRDPYNRFAWKGETPYSHTTDFTKGEVKRLMQESRLNYVTIKYHWLIVGIYPVAVVILSILAAVDPLESLYFLFVVPAALTQLTLRLALWTSHVRTIGYRNYNTPDNSNNWWFLSLISGGEGWHNNHHHKPNSSRFSSKWWEFDLGYVLIRFISKQPAK